MANDGIWTLDLPKSAEQYRVSISLCLDGAQDCSEGQKYRIFKFDLAVTLTTEDGGVEKKASSTFSISTEPNA
jgi:hypothetical protein